MAGVFSRPCYRTGLQPSVFFSGLALVFMVVITGVSLCNTQVSHETLERIVTINNVRVQPANIPPHDSFARILFDHRRHKKCKGLKVHKIIAD
jgi:hypothetical protein